AQHLGGGEVVGSSRSLGGRNWRPASRLVARGWVFQQERANYRHHKENHAQYLERGAPAKVRDQVTRGQRPEDCRPSSVSAHCQSYGQPALVREPLGHDRDRRGIAKAVTQSPQYAEEDEKLGQAVSIRAKEKAKAHQNRAN